jgi:hypothetical protein
VWGRGGHLQPVLGRYSNGARRDASSALRGQYPSGSFALSPSQSLRATSASGSRATVSSRQCESGTFQLALTCVTRGSKSSLSLSS